MVKWLRKAWGVAVVMMLVNLRKDLRLARASRAARDQTIEELRD
jgi:hypothetical protein